MKPFANNRIDYVVALADTNKKQEVLTIGISNIPELEIKLEKKVKYCSCIDLDKEKLNYAKLLNALTYIPKFTNPFYLASGIASPAGKVYRSVTTATYDFGSAVRDWFRKTTSLPTPQPKPA